MRALVGHRRRAAALAAAAATLLLAAPALAAPGSLDRSFSGDGRLVVKTARESTRGNVEVTRLEPIAMASATAPDGGLAAANGRRVLRYRADGRPKRRFGGNGRAAIPTAAGTSFRLAGVAVDSRGRVLVAGTTRPREASGGGSRDARLALYRFLPNGRLDRGFGDRGLAGARLGPLEASGLAVDSRNRPVLTGFSALTPSSCATTPVYLNTTAVVRLTARGAPDPSFGGGDGVYTDPLEDPRLPTLTAGGRVVYVSGADQRCDGFADNGGLLTGGPSMVSTLSPGGDLLRRFPVPSGAPHSDVTSLAVDRRNRIVLLLSAIPPEGGGIVQQLRRLLPDGSPDRSFGVVRSDPGLGSSPEGVPGGRAGAVATDGRNRVIVAGSAPRREGRFVARQFYVLRLNAAGRVQARFGRQGVARARFGRRAVAEPTQVSLDNRGRIVLAGTVEAPRLPTRFGLAFARFLGGGR